MPRTMRGAFASLMSAGSTSRFKSPRSPGGMAGGTATATALPGAGAGGSGDTSEPTLATAATARAASAPSADAPSASTRWRFGERAPPPSLASLASLAWLASPGRGRRFRPPSLVAGAASAARAAPSDLSDPSAVWRSVRAVASSSASSQVAMHGSSAKGSRLSSHSAIFASASTSTMVRGPRAARSDRKRGPARALRG